MDGKQRIQTRAEWGIPQDAFVVGNFQKDGNGWGSGDEPKLIKGPDTLADMLIELHRQRPVFAFIPGPARGYLAQRLTEAGVPFANPGFVTDGEKFRASYHALDVYVSPSRDEGGPAGIMEAMASGIPVVSTRSGMPVDYIEHGVNGYLANVEDHKGLAEHCLRLLENSDLAKEVAARGYETIQRYDWAVLAPQYYELLYQRLGMQ
jgi:glycosyltransferase involved in cell wall biosynthesis